MRLDAITLKHRLLFLSRKTNTPIMRTKKNVRPTYIFGGITMNKKLHEAYENLYAMMEQVDNLIENGLEPNRTLLRMIEEQRTNIKELNERMEANDI